MSEQKHTPGPWKEWENTKPTADDKQRIQQKASELYDEFREWAEWEACQNGAEYEHMYQRQQVNKKVAELTKENERWAELDKVRSEAEDNNLDKIKALTEQVEKLKAKPIEVLERIKLRLSEVITSDIHLVEKWEIEKLIKELQNDD